MKKKTKNVSTLKKEKFSALTWIIFAILMLYCLALVGILVWALISSFKDPLEFRINIIGFPKTWTINNYLTVANLYSVNVETAAGTAKVGMPMLYLNGFLYALGCAFASTLVSCVTAYVCAKFNYKFSKVIYIVAIITMILPIVGNLPAEIQVAKTFGLFDQIWGLWIMKANFLGLYFLIFFGFFKNLPDAYIEAAKIDGSNNFHILIKIILPLARNLFFTILLLNFIAFWNDYSVPLVYLPTHPTIAVGVLKMAKATENSLSTVPMRTAGAFLMLTPILVLFLIFHKRLLGNLTMGGLKQ